MIEDSIEGFLDWFESLLIKQQRIATFILTESEKVPLEISLDILKTNITVLEIVSEIVETIYDMDEYVREKAWEMCCEAVSWANLILMSADKSAYLFLRHLNVKGLPLLYTLEKLSQDMYKDYQAVEMVALQRSIEDVIKILKQQVDLTTKFYNRVL